jgi:hypothetical protein
MRILRNLLVIIGLITVLGGGFLFYHVWSATRNFDPDAFSLYREFITKLMETQDLADAFVWAVPVNEGIEVEDLKKSLKSLAVSKNFLFVNDSPFYKQVEAVTGQHFRHVSFMQFCDVRVGMKMLNYNNAYSAFMPCVISIVEDRDGKLWLYAMNMDFLIHGAKELPRDLKEAAIQVRRTMREIMEGAAAGDF